MARTNCLFWALAMCRRRAKRGVVPYMLIRKSLWGPFPHVLYAEQRRSGSWRVVSYKPVAPHRKPLPPVRFNGRPDWGDL